MTKRATWWSIALLVSGCTASVNGPTSELERVEQCVAFCESTFDEACEDNFVGFTVGVPPEPDRGLCARICQNRVDEGQATGETCEDVANAWIDCLSAGPTCEWTTRCAAEMTGRDSCYRDFCAASPERCNVGGDWPRLPGS